MPAWSGPAAAFGAAAACAAAACSSCNHACSCVSVFVQSRCRRPLRADTTCSVCVDGASTESDEADTAVGQRTKAGCSILTPIGREAIPPPAPHAPPPTARAVVFRGVLPLPLLAPTAVAGGGVPGGGPSPSPSECETASSASECTSSKQSSAPPCSEHQTCRQRAGPSSHFHSQPHPPRGTSIIERTPPPPPSRPPPPPSAAPCGERRVRSGVAFHSAYSRCFRWTESSRLRPWSRWRTRLICRTLSSCAPPQWASSSAEIQPASSLPLASRSSSSEAAASSAAGGRSIRKRKVRRGVATSKWKSAPSVRWVASCSAIRPAACSSADLAR
mmetsp:Transcript_59110/g.162135  ORF Transcript_59110/g.162135 Transcript_59110/m.162135 type:complete len:331 (-) Transcript_59110:813-1805(-)